MGRGRSGSSYRVFSVCGRAWNILLQWDKTAVFSWHWKIYAPKWEMMKEIGQFSFLTCLQQSVMNLGILMVQGLVNSFGTVIMAAFAAAVKIDSLRICLCRTLEMLFPLL